METWQKGELAVLAVCKRCMEKGIWVSRPVVEGCRYDLILDDGHELTKIQIKYVSAKNGVARVSLRKVNNGKGYLNKRLYTSNEIDLVLVYIPESDKVYYIPPYLFEEKTEVSLRLEPPKKQMLKVIRMAEDFEW
jgi:hypothetical protein